MKVRINPSSNYKGIFLKNGTTLRYKLNEENPFLPLKNPELADISLNTLCYGKCPQCYTSAMSSGKNYSNVVAKIKNFYEPLNDERPFQVAIGGGGEPTLHPDFCEVLKTFYELEITPNYTTNGMHLSDKILEYTKQYSGGVAVSTHRHLKWFNAAEQLLNAKIRTNLHIIVGEKGSIEQLKWCYEKFPEIETFVLLPYQVAGRAKEINNDILLNEWKECVNFVMSNNKEKFAFGALFYPFMLENKQLFEDVDIYEPEMFSGYLMLDDNPILRRSSYDLRERTI